MTIDIQPRGLQITGKKVTDIFAYGQDLDALLSSLLLTLVDAEGSEHYLIYDELDKETRTRMFNLVQGSLMEEYTDLRTDVEYE